MSHQNNQLSNNIVTNNLLILKTDFPCEECHHTNASPHLKCQDRLPAWRMPKLQILVSPTPTHKLGSHQNKLEKIYIIILGLGLGNNIM